MENKDYIEHLINLANKMIEIKMGIQLQYNTIDNDIKSVAKDYDTILDKFVQLCTEFDLSNSLEIANLFTYLLWNGYFSQNKNFEYKVDGRLNATNAYSFDIMNGIGVCLNISDMLNDILKKCGYSSIMFYNRFICLKHKDYIPKVKRNIEKQRKSLIKLMVEHIFKVGNHVCVLIHENDRFYLYDPTNLLILNVDTLKRSSMINCVGTIENQINSSYKFISDKDKFNEYILDDLVSDLKNNINKKCFYDSTFFENSWINNSKKCAINNSLLESYYDDIKIHIDNIADKVKKLVK